MKNKHWADIYAEKIVRERGKKDHYTCASGITPSGTVHIGNFREIISVDIVVRALKDLGVTPRFIYSWDDFDVFRKVPQNITQRDEFKQYLRMPIVDIPDPWGKTENFAKNNELAIEALLSSVGIVPEYIYQAKQYRKGTYAEGMRKALLYRSDIKEILNAHRTTPLPEDWYPISVFSSFTNKDATKIIGWDGEWGVTYRCLATNQEETIDLRDSTMVKLLWRIDWPMRWEYEDVDFEPAGKDHHSQGGSFDTAKEIVSVVYKHRSPVTFQYDFIRVKGGAGKMSSSSGEIVSLSGVLEIYQPQIVRYLFASTRPNAEFAISFDIDVIKVYEDYDRCERMCFCQETVNESRREKEKRIYELSQVGTIPDTPPLQIPFRHICNLLQIYRGEQEQVIHALRKEYFTIDKTQAQYLMARMRCAWNWIRLYAPEDFKFTLRAVETLSRIKETESEQHAVQILYHQLHDTWDSTNDKKINECIYAAAREAGIEPQAFFGVLYQRLIAKAKGPRLGSFLYILGKDVVEQYLTIHNIVHNGV